MANVESMKQKIVGYAIATVVLIIGVPIYLGGKQALASQAGTTCDTQTSCRGAGLLSSGMCLEGDGAAYCSHDCGTAADCPSGLACEGVEGAFTTETTNGNHASTSRSTHGTKMLCVKPTSTASTKP